MPNRLPLGRRSRAEVEKVRKYADNAESAINNLEIRPRRPYKYPFDIVAVAILSKVFALSKACLELLNSGFPDEAYGLSRSIVECATNLRFLTADPALQNQRTRDFVRYALAYKAFWAHYALQQFAGRKEEREIGEYARQQGIVPDTKTARRHWSNLSSFIWDVMTIDHPLDGPATLQHKKIAYAADYFDTSAFVHCSLSAIDNYFAEEAVPFKVSHSLHQAKSCQATLFITLIYLHSAIAYALFGMNVDRPAELTSLFQRTLKGLKPVPIIVRRTH